MTTLVILRDENKIFLGADRRSTWGTIINDHRMETKIVQKPHMFITATGESLYLALASMIADKMSVSLENDASEIVHEFISLLDEHLKSFEGLSETSDDDFSSTILLLVKGRIFGVSLTNRQYDYSYEIKDQFHSRGTGEFIARGMYLYLKTTDSSNGLIMKKIFEEVPFLDSASGGGAVIYEYDLDSFNAKTIYEWKNE